MGALEDKAHIFGTIFTLSNKLQILGDRIDMHITVKQWLFLAGVLKCGTQAPTISEIAARTGSSRQNVKKMALLLEKQGFVRMEKDVCDARMLRVALTDACGEHLARREEMELRFMEELFWGFAPEELSLLSRGLEKLEKNAGCMGRKYEETEV